MSSYGDKSEGRGSPRTELAVSSSSWSSVSYCKLGIWVEHGEKESGIALPVVALFFHGVAQTQWRSRL